MIFTLLFVQDRPPQIQVDTRPQLNDFTAGFANSTEETYGGMYKDGERFVYLVVGKETYRTVVAETLGKTSSRMYREVKYSLKKLEQTVEQLKSLLGTAPAREGNPALFQKASWGIDVMNNRVVVYTDDETIKALVLQHFEKDLILFQGALIVTEQ